MRSEILKLAADLAARGEPFVLAVVVRREPASSAQPGNTAVVTKDGVVHGWLGGSCIQPTVEREARRALEEGRPRLVSLSPEPDRDRRPGVVVHPMTCHSGGTVDIYLEPVRPAPRLLVFGLSPTAQALCALGKAMGSAAGGFTTGPAPVVDLLRQRSRTSLFSNALPPGVAASSLEAFRMLMEDPSPAHRVQKNALTFRARMAAAGFRIPDGIHPIVPVIVGDTAKALAMSDALFQRGVYVSGFGFPVAALVGGSSLM